MDTESQACDQCYRTKQTCSKGLPRCQRCLDASNPCTYSFGKFMGKPKRSNKARRESSSNLENGSDGQFFGLLNLKNDITSPTQNAWTSSSWDLIPEGLSSDHSSASNPTSPTRARTHSLASASGNRIMASPACDQCYRFKVKCSRDPDCCRRCANNRSVCTYSAAAGKPDQHIVKAGKEHKQKRAKQLQLDEPSTVSTELRGSSADLSSYPFTESPSSQQAEIQVDDLGSFYGFDIPTIETPTYDFSATSVPPTPATSWATNPSTLYELETMGLGGISDQYPLHWQAPETLQSPVFTNQIAHQKFPSSPNPGPGPRELPTPTSPAFPRENNQATTCGCFSTALNVLNGLHSCIQQHRLESSRHTELATQSHSNVLSATINALETCESSTHCTSTHNSMISMLYAIILQQISTCYEMFSRQYQQTMQEKTWLASQRARGVNICHEMELRLRNTFEEVEDQSEVLGRNSVVGLLASVRGKFSEGVQGVALRRLG